MEDFMLWQNAVETDAFTTESNLCSSHFSSFCSKITTWLSWFINRSVLLKQIFSKMMSILVAFFLTTSLVKSDTFNYDSTHGTNYGPKEWNQIECSDVATCVRKNISANCKPPFQLQTHNNTYCNHSQDGLIIGSFGIHVFHTKRAKMLV
jgi:hypothetical protein